MVQEDRLEAFISMAFILIALISPTPEGYTRQPHISDW
jgi:hypothetical protein